MFMFEKALAGSRRYWLWLLALAAVIEQQQAPGRASQLLADQGQGLCVGAGGITEAWAGYDPATHPIVRLLLEGGPYALAQFAVERGFGLEAGYADACHLCYRAREYLRPQFPDLLGPDEMYGD